jgi:hypothetical protein
MKAERGYVHLIYEPEARTDPVPLAAGWHILGNPRALSDLVVAYPPRIAPPRPVLTALAEMLAVARTVTVQDGTPSQRRHLIDRLDAAGLSVTEHPRMKQRRYRSRHGR